MECCKLPMVFRTVTDRLLMARQKCLSRKPVNHRKDDLRSSEQVLDHNGKLRGLTVRSGKSLEISNILAEMLPELIS
jgi:hypothetical protein